MKRHRLGRIAISTSLIFGIASSLVFALALAINPALSHAAMDTWYPTPSSCWGVYNAEYKCYVSECSYSGRKPTNNATYFIQEPETEYPVEIDCKITVIGTYCVGTSNSTNLDWDLVLEIDDGTASPAESWSTTLTNKATTSGSACADGHTWWVQDTVNLPPNENYELKLSTCTAGPNSLGTGHICYFSVELL